MCERLRGWNGRVMEGERERVVGVVIESHKRRLLGRAMFRHANACTHPTQHIHTQIPHVHTERKHTHISIPPRPPS